MDLASGYPFWPVNDGLIRTYPKLDTDVRCDVAIIGAGITGALVAHTLVDAGFDTVVIDRRETAWGSTASSTALLQYEIDVLLIDLAKIHGHARAARAYVACLEAVHTIERLARGVRADVGFDRKRSLYLGTRKRDARTLRAEHAARRAIGIDVEWLDRGDVVDRCGIDRPAALLSRDGAQVDAYAFAHALLHRACARGVRLFDRSAVVTIDATRGGVRLVTSDKHTIRAGRLVFASGYETQDFLEQRVARLTSTFAIATEPLPPENRWDGERTILWEHAKPYLYLRPTRDHRVIIGGDDEPFRDPDHRERLLPRKAQRLLARFHELFPDRQTEIAFAWAGTFGETDDGLAYIGAHRDWPRSYFALGYGGNGITYGAIAAEVIRDALVGRRNDCAELFAFDR
ncbi:MAG TPA: FAD-dependent oxidoreductase [Gemmatimonadaceae bacterium]|jgi:glycine/D-amino acid oxidase-like deaminating enzyme|nr:FAD-dependent oxidoreductase [Gemmatimonadaceae bacterium]